jgi:hypothetical protein
MTIRDVPCNYILLNLKSLETNDAHPRRRRLPGKDGRYYFQLFQWDAAKSGFFLITGVIDRVH